MITMLRHLRKPLTETGGRLIAAMQSEPRIKPIGRMFSVQYSLPKLPVPPMEQTLQKYLRAIRPLVNDEDFRHTEKLVGEFKNAPGPELQRILETRAEERTNWLSDWWKDVAYLSVRSPVVINSNPCIIFPKEDYTDLKGQLRYAAKLVAGAIDYKVMIDNQTLPVELLGGKPLCMTQYYTILAGCRVPGVKRDSHVIHPSTQPNAPRHITVLHNNQIFALDVYGKDGNPLSVDQLQDQLSKIVDMSQDRVAPIGLLTMTDRTSWAKSYNKLVKDKSNKAALESVHSSIFVLCLDGKGRQGEDEAKTLSLSTGQMLHGGGSAWMSGNRWFDKTMQFIVGENGVSGMNYEHTTAEGPPIAALMDHVLSFCGSYKDSGSGCTGLSDPRKMDLSISNGVLEDIEEAKVQVDNMTRDLDITVWTYQGYGKDFAKAQKLSPDGFIQVAFQLAYYKLYGETCATYETGSLRRFQLGRTDTIRSCSVDSFNFTKAMVDSNTSREAKADLFRQAVMAHRKYTDETINGNGIDRHLLGWKLAAVEAGLNIPDLHMDGSYARSLYFKLSTSQVGAKHNAVMAFGPVVPDGYGVCYNPQKSSINFSVSAFFNSPETDSKKFADSIRDSLDDIQSVLGPQAAKL